MTTGADFSLAPRSVITGYATSEACRRSSTETRD
jgi:hypothetical protein